MMLRALEIVGVRVGVEHGSPSGAIGIAIPGWGCESAYHGEGGEGRVDWGSGF